jgi:aminopeptidase YwaD
MRRPLVASIVALLACRPAAPPSAPTPAGPDSQAAPEQPWQSHHVDLERLRGHLTYLADDARQGRAPGTPGDREAAKHVEDAYSALGLTPAFPGGFCQSFTLTDGVRLRTGETASLKLAGAEVPLELVPFSQATAAAVRGKLVYLGHGVDDGPALAKVTRGAIVVVRAGAPDDPHLDPTRTRTQSKLIAARDRGAIGFILWDPDSDLPFPNHGEANDLKLPAVAIGKAGTPALLAAFAIPPSKPETKPETAPDPHHGLTPGKQARKPASIHTPVERVELSTCNIGAVLPGNGHNKRIVVGAHIDHLGLGTSSSLAPGQQAVHNGADDNASGVATMLAVAAELAAVPVAQRPYDVEFVAFGAEEMGLLGSKHYVGALTPEARARLVAMLNYDMVGRMQNDSVVVSGVGSSSVWPGLLKQAAGELTIRPSEDGFGASDQASFYTAGLPVLHFFSGTHADYHKPSDDLDKINFEGAAAIGDLSLRVLLLVMAGQPSFDYLKVAAAAPRAGGFRVSLGTVPDYAAKVDGVQLADVRAGGPAAAAGIQAGDIITKIGAREIHNFDDYMATFAELKPGVAAPIRVLRAGQPLDLQITPAAPQRR